MLFKKTIKEAKVKKDVKSKVSRQKKVDDEITNINIDILEANKRLTRLIGNTSETIRFLQGLQRKRHFSRKTSKKQEAIIRTLINSINFIEANRLKMYDENDK